MAEEIIRDEIDKILTILDLNELLDLTKDLNINTTEEEQNKKRLLLRILQKHIDSITDIDILNQAKESLKKLTTDAETADNQIKNGADIADDKTTTNKEADITKKEEKVKGINTGFLEAAGFSETSAFHKDFKIRGLIGEVHQKDKLSYLH